MPGELLDRCWAYFTSVDKDKVKCQYCNVKMPVNTNRMRLHLLNFCKNVSDYVKEDLTPQSSTSTADIPDSDNNDNYSDSDEEEVFTAEEILDFRVTRRGVEYLVKWLGYPEEDNTWEPEENMVQNSDMELLKPWTRQVDAALRAMNQQMKGDKQDDTNERGKRKCAQKAKSRLAKLCPSDLEDNSDNDSTYEEYLDESNENGKTRKKSLHKKSDNEVGKKKRGRPPKDPSDKKPIFGPTKKRGPPKGVIRNRGNMKDHELEIWSKIYTKAKISINLLDDDTSADHTCKLCGLEFSKDSFLCYHLEICHSTLPELASALDESAVFVQNGNKFCCRYCNRVFDDKDRVLRHKVLKHDVAKPVQCDLCPETKESGYRILIHRRQEHSKEPLTYKCNDCKFVTYSIGSYKNHKTRRHASKEVLFKCPVEGCNHTSNNSKIDIERHQLDVHGIGQWTCPSCSFLCTKTAMVRFHKRKLCRQPSFNKDKPYCCMDCKATFKSDNLLHAHRSYSCVIINQKKVEKGMDVYFTCEGCGMKFTRHKAVLRHQGKQHWNNKVACDGPAPYGTGQYSAPYVDPESGQMVRKEVTTGKVVDIPQSRPRRSQRCDQCGDIFDGFKLLEAHILAVHEKNPNFSAPKPRVCVSGLVPTQNDDVKKRKSQVKSLPSATKSKGHKKKRTDNIHVSEVENNSTQSEYIDFNEIAIAEVVAQNEPNNQISPTHQYMIHQSTSFSGFRHPISVGYDGGIPSCSQTSQAAITLQQMSTQSSGHPVFIPAGACPICDVYQTDIRSHLMSYHRIPPEKLYRYF